MLSILPGSAAYSATAQLLKNPSFESPATGQGQPDDWVSMGGERIVSSQIMPPDPPPSTYPDGKQVVRAYVVTWGLVPPQGWRQTVHVVAGETYELKGYVWTSEAGHEVHWRYPAGRIGVDLDGASASVAEVDIWGASPGE